MTPTTSRRMRSRDLKPSHLVAGGAAKSESQEEGSFIGGTDYPGFGGNRGNWFLGFGHLWTREYLARS